MFVRYRLRHWNKNFVIRYGPMRDTWEEAAKDAVKAKKAIWANEHELKLNEFAMIEAVKD